MPRPLDALPDASLRQFPRPDVPPPDQTEDVHLIGICGTGMGALAGLFHEAGLNVRGSDDGVYPPMSTHLAERGISVQEGYDPAHLDPAPDLTVVGNTCTPTHPEAAVAREERLPQQSFPEALSHHFLRDRRPLVVAGTHGKTTTTGLLVHLLRHAGVDPGFLIGGVMEDTDQSYALGTDAPFVVEGDEYDSAYFDKRPKFLHYRPQSALVTSLEFDHADIFVDRNDYRGAFEAFVGLLPSDGHLALCGDAPAVRALADHTSASVHTYGLAPHNDVHAEGLAPTDGGLSFTLRMGSRSEDVRLLLPGRHNVQNALGAALLARHEGVSPSTIAAGLASFGGMKRRQQVRGRPNDVLVVDDFAHHPTAVEATVQALNTAHPDRRLVAIFEPRSNTSRRARFEDAYGAAFDAADRVFLKAPPVRHNDDPDAMLDAAAVARTIRGRGVPTEVFEDVDDVLSGLTDALQPGDVALLMSNGSFGGLPERLPEALAEAE
ncbi:UDP-N-acetylmuramate--L-alanine ligase [Salinibacter altiplanensis]|uniref:UDP-N-acetylmuramate--L-alanine ligase n=1 Tax=Salinibacter altiplanensis TaxID=1803181 RepID=UPI000C9F9F1C|nr:Mur ligase family protein [Salinibacter altiplanensis]